jgi:hypothetical protein
MRRGQRSGELASEAGQISCLVIDLVLPPSDRVSVGPSVTSVHSSTAALLVQLRVPFPQSEDRRTLGTFHHEVVIEGEC